jgi:hypothetical protein
VSAIPCGGYDIGKLTRVEGTTFFYYDAASGALAAVEEIGTTIKCYARDSAWMQPTGCSMQGCP